MVVQDPPCSADICILQLSALLAIAMLHMLAYMYGTNFASAHLHPPRTLLSFPHSFSIQIPPTGHTSAL
jgi:hypothetical protein